MPHRTPCSATTTISAGGQVIARTPVESLGSNTVGYLRFRLTTAGHSLLARSRGNQTVRPRRALSRQHDGECGDRALGVPLRLAGARRRAAFSRGAEGA